MLGFAPSLRLGAGLGAEISEEVAEQALAALREALSNVARHAGASRVDVSLHAGDEVSLVVADDGSGLKDVSRRSGLANLEDRAVQLGGSMKVESAPDEGTRLSWRVPLPAAEQADG